MSINYGSILDTRDLEKRIDELEALQDAIKDAHDAVMCSDSDTREDAKSELHACQQALDDEQEWETELEELQSARDEIGEWIHGETMIPRDKWEDYCRELVEDCGYLPKDLPGFIENNINWSGVADDLEADYGSLTLDGTDYLYRNC
jgi:hypothetical protein